MGNEVGKSKTASHAHRDQHSQRQEEEEEEVTTIDEKENKNGLIKWRVTGNLLHQFKNAKQKQRFDSPQFRTIDGTTWRIYIYPRGRYSPDHCGIGLGCVQLSDNKQRIGVNFSFNVVEVDWIDDRHGYTFKRDGHKLGDNAFAIEQLMNVDSLTIKCFVEETMDVSEDNIDFEWKITNYWLKKWKNAKYEQVFCSPRFNAIGQEWAMQIYPNGMHSKIKGTADLVIAIKSDKEKELNVCHYIGIDALNIYQIDFDGDTLNKDMVCILCTSPFQLDDIQNESEITICVKIWEKGSIDRNEGRLISNIYSDKMRKIQHPSAETNRHLRHENERLKSKVQKTTIDHAKALESLDAFTKSLQSEIARLQTENNELNESQKEHLEIQKENERWKTTAQKARMDHVEAMTEITRLRTENSELNEECKETKLELIRVKKESLRKVRMNTMNYLEWTDSEVVDWIISIHNGEYAQYEHDLRLLFAKESVNGAVLSEISKSDLKDWGIHNFSHRSNLYKQIQKLINQQNKAIQDIEGQGNTAYI